MKGMDYAEAQAKLAALHSRKPTVVVDWDGTCVPSAWPEKPGKWQPGAPDALWALLGAGFDVKIHSCRTHALDVDGVSPNSDRLASIRYIRRMLDSAGLGDDVEIIIDNKPAALYYVDDRAIKYNGDWEEVVDQIVPPEEDPADFEFRPGGDFADKLIRTFETGATRDQDTTKFDYEGFLSPVVLQRFAEFMHSHRVQPDGSTRDSDNWQKGIPVDAYMKSLWRHFMAVWLLHRGQPAYDEKGEPVDILTELMAVLFNVQGMAFELLKAAELERAA